MFSIFKNFSRFNRYNKKAQSKPLFLGSAIPFSFRAIESDGVAFSCIDRIATTVAGLSFGVFWVNSGKKAENHPLFETLKEPNIDETGFFFRYQLVLDYFYKGNVYIYIYRDENGQCTNLFRLNPSDVLVDRDELNRKKFHYNGKTYDSTQILHIPSRFGYDTLKGKSIFDVCKSCFDTNAKLDGWTDSSFNNGINSRLVIDVSEKFPNATEEQMLALRERYIQTYGGAENAYKPIVKTNNVKFETLQNAMADNRSQELSENRNYQMKVISMLFGVPFELLSGENGGLDIEKLTTLYSQNAILPIVQQLEESFQKLLSIDQRSRYCVKFNYNSLLRTSLSAKIDALVKEVNNGLLSVNEARAKLENGLPDIEAGDWHYRPASLLPILDELEKSLGASAKLKQSELDSQTDTAASEQKNAEAQGLGSELMQ